LDKTRKQRVKQAQQTAASDMVEPVPSSSRLSGILPWALLLFSWVGFIVYFFVAR
jgi:hypothetical protein